jgi:hypothetical protein
MPLLKPFGSIKEEKCVINAGESDMAKKKKKK